MGTSIGDNSFPGTSAADEEIGVQQADGKGHFGGGSVVTLGLGAVPVYGVGFGMSKTPLTGVAALSDGGYVVAWSVMSKTTIYVYTQEFDADGVKVGSIQQVSNWGEAPAVAAMDDGGYVVAWESLGTFEQPGHEVMVQRFDSDGAPVGGQTQVNTTTAGNQFQPAVAALSDGGYVVTWASYGQGIDYYDIYAQRYDDTGAAVGGETRVNTTTVNIQEIPSITALSNGGYVVTWASDAQDGSGYGIYARRFDDAGAPASGETQVNTSTAGHQWNASTTALSDGGYLVTWASDDIYSQRFDNMGNAVGGETRVNTIPTDSHLVDPSVAAMSDGGYVVTWQSLDANDTNVYAQRFDSSGAPVGGEMNIDGSTGAFQSGPAIAGLTDGGFVLTWWDARAGTVALYAQRFEAALVGTADRDWLEANDSTHMLFGDAGDDRLYGLAGDDSLDGGADDDFMAGGAGDDTYFVDTASDKVMERPGDGHDTVESSVSYELGRQVENLTLTGSVAIDGTGNALDNTLIGNSAANRLAGGLGNDTLDGRGGHDVLVFDTRPGTGNVDVLVNFVAADDVIELGGRIFGGIDATGTLSADAFQHGAGAIDSSDRIIHDPATGALMYDADGIGGEAAVQIATLVGLVGILSADNFVLI